MKNFKTQNGGYRYHDRDLGELIEVAVRYDLGGPSMFSGREQKRGVYVHITPKNVEETEVPGLRYEKIKLFGSLQSSGAKLLVKPLARRNDRAVLLVVEILDPIVANICETFRTDPQAAFEMVKAQFSDQITV
jgi:hypothetical protein